MCWAARLDLLERECAGAVRGCFSSAKSRRHGGAGGLEEWSPTDNEETLQRNKNMQAGRTEEGDEVKQQETLAFLTRMMNKMKATGGKDAQHSWWDIDSLAHFSQKRGSTQDEGTQCISGATGCKEREKERRRKASNDRGSDNVKCCGKPAGMARRSAGAGRIGGPMRRCEEQRKERARHWPCDSNEQFRRFEEALPQLKEESLERVARSCKGYHGRLL